MEDVKLTYKQLIQVLLISRTIIAITTLPVLNSPPKNQDVWISELLSFPITIILAIPVYVLWNRFPNCSIIQYSKCLLGKLGVIIGLLIAWFFIHITALNLGILGEFITVAVFQEAPRVFFILTMTIAAAYAVYKGIEVIGRVSEIIAPIILISVLTIFLLIMKDMKLEPLKPILEKGIIPVFQGSLVISIRTFEILALAIILPNLNDRSKAGKVMTHFNFLSIIVFLLITIPVLTVLGVNQGKKSLYPYFYLIKIVDVGGFVERIDALHMAIWILGIYIRIAFFFYLSVLCISQVFNFNDYKPFIIPLGTILIPLSIIMTPNVIELNKFLSYKILIPYTLFFIFIIPSLLLFIYLVKKKGEKTK